MTTFIKQQEHLEKAVVHVREPAFSTNNRIICNKRRGHCVLQAHLLQQFRKLIKRHMSSTSQLGSYTNKYSIID